jgi:GntR family transcriptional regulator, rspAB operon transcriptional repressor
MAVQTAQFHCYPRRIMATPTARASPPIRTVREQIADQLRNEILSRQHGADTHLREEALAARFGTSRGPIRDVLLQLTQEGALVYRPNAGVRISPPPEPATRELLMNLRTQIELHAIPRFVEQLTPDDEQALRDILETMERACRRGSMPDIVGSDIALHRHIVRRGAAPEIEKVWMNVAVRMLMAYSRFGDFMEIHREHVRIVEAICAKDLESARSALKDNLI